MGKAARWFKGLFGIKKDKENVETSSNCSDKKDKEKKRWSFAKSGKDSSSSGGIITGQIPAKIPVKTDSAWLRSYISQTEKDQNKHAIAVAAATAAAADAAVAAAQAAVAVVRLTSQGSRGSILNGGGNNNKKKWAAIKIQNIFRGYLARKALRALKGLVKLQALIRGYLVRKRAAATLHSMQALIRAQTAVRSQRARRSINNDPRYPPEMRARRSIEKFDECRSEYHSKRLSASYDASLSGFDESPKIVEIDTINKHRSRSSRRIINTCMSDYSGDDQHYYQAAAISSPFPCPARLSIPDCNQNQDYYDWSYVADDYKFATAQSTPRFVNSGQCYSHNPVTPSKSVCGDSFIRPYSHYPSYMANTLSSRAKLRSHSAPKQRPEPAAAAAAASGPAKKRLSLNEIMASRTSFSGVRMQKCTQVQEDLAF